MQCHLFWPSGAHVCNRYTPWRGRQSSLLHFRKRIGSATRIQARFGGNGGLGGWGGSGGGGDGRGNPGRGWNSDPFASMFATVGQDQKQKKQKQEVILLTMSAFAVTRAAFSRITKRFTKYYRETTGREVRSFVKIDDESGIQARAVIDGLPADIVALALPLDVIKIQQAGLINDDWQRRTENNGVFAESVVSVVVRKGNPHGIVSWADLVKDGVEVITANPKTAGVARWNFLALWGFKMSKGDGEAQKYVTEVFDHVPVQPRDAREASDVFYKQEVGDALLTYENEVIMTNRMVGDNFALPYVVPDNNIRVEAPVAIVDKNMSTKSEDEREAAKAFVNFLFTPEAQREFVACGFRSVNSTVKKETDEAGTFPKVKSLWTVDKKLGGWLEAQKKFFDADKILDQIQTEIGQRRLELQRQQQR